MTDWTGFYLASGVAAAVLTGLLFIAVALRPRKMTDAPGLLRARAAFIALAVVTYVSLLELIPGNRLVVGAGLILLGSAAPALTVRFAVEDSVSRWRISALFLSGGLISMTGLFRLFDRYVNDGRLVVSLAVLIVLCLGLLDSWEFASTDRER